MRYVSRRRRGEFIGDNPVRAEAGIATILLKTGASPGAIQVTATADGVEPASRKFLLSSQA